MVEREQRFDSKKWQREFSNSALPAEYDPFPGGHNAAAPTCFALLYRNKHGNIHIHHAGWLPADFAAERTLR